MSNDLGSLKTDDGAFSHYLEHIRINSLLTLETKYTDVTIHKLKE